MLLTCTDELKKTDPERAEERALSETSVDALSILSSSCNLHELGRLLVEGKFIAKGLMRTIVEGLLKGKYEQACAMLEAVGAQLKHNPSKMKNLLEALDKFPHLRATIEKMKSTYVQFAINYLLFHSTLLDNSEGPKGAKVEENVDMDTTP